MMEMTSSRPYLVRAMYQWISDNGFTPYLLVDAGAEDCMVPVAHIQDGKIILNIAPMAINGLTLGDEAVTFSARFSGITEAIYVPIDAVLAIYSKENGQGMMFNDDAGSASISAPGSNDAKSNGTRSNGTKSNGTGQDDDTNPDGPGAGPGRPSGPKLRVVK